MQELFVTIMRNQGTATLLGLGCTELEIYLFPGRERALVITMWPTEKVADAADVHPSRKDLQERLKETIAAPARFERMEQVLAVR